jgi:ethanolamine kinase
MTMTSSLSKSDLEKIQIDEDNEQLAKKTIAQLAQTVRPEWNSEEIRISLLNGGVTNKLFSCYSDTFGLDSAHTLLFRIYGKKTEQFISRDEEIRVMEWAQSVGLGPRFYFKFKNGICYEYLPGRILDYELVQDASVYPRIAEAIASLHLINFKGLRVSSELEPGESVFIFSKIKQLIELLGEGDYSTSMRHMDESLLARTPCLDQIRKEFLELAARIDAYTQRHQSALVFAHNDLLLGNIIYNSDEKRVKFIDYEYGALNFQAYDVANHFNEFAGVDEPNYELFPSEEYRLAWIEIYLKSFYSKLNRFFSKQSDSVIQVDEARVSEFSREVNMFTLASHFMWAIWALVQAQNSTLDFNFVKYANIRFGQYFKNKEKFLPKE